MNKTWIIIKREYLQAVKKKSFILMTFLGPLLIAALIIAPTLVMRYGNDTTDIAVLDDSGIYSNLDSPNDKEIHFIYVESDIESLKQAVVDKKYDALLYIPDDIMSLGGMVYSAKALNSGVMSNILSTMKANLSQQILINDFNINKDSLDTYIAQHTDMLNLGYTFVKEENNRLVEEPKASNTRAIQLIIGIGVGLIIYMFIFSYCSMVLRGVLEEKTNRIVEIIVSSVKPIQLMIGKIVGVAFIGLTQLALWLLLTGIILFVFSIFFIGGAPDAGASLASGSMMGIDAATLSQVAEQGNSPIIDSLLQVNFVQIIALFVFYFMGGYFLYATLYAAVGAAVDNDTDTQQFILPLTLPLILAMILSTFIADNPDGSVAFWLSIIPFTSPMVMLMRIPAGVEIVQMWEILLSCSILVLTCIGTTWIAAKIYKTGILMYGKKISYKELWKWIRYKN